MRPPVIFVAKTPDQQLNNTLETIAVNLNYLGELAYQYVNVRSSWNTVKVTTPWTQLTPVSGTLYQTTSSASIITSSQLLLIDASIQLEFDYTVVTGLPVPITLSIVRKSSASVSYNPVTDTVSEITYWTTTASGVQKFNTTAVFSGIVDTPPAGNFDYCVFVKYVDGSITANQFTVRSSTITLRETR